MGLTRFRIVSSPSLALLTLLLALARISSAAPAHHAHSHAALDDAGPVTLTPADVEAGSPELIRVSAPDAIDVNGEWFGHKLQFSRSTTQKYWYALAGVDVEAPTVPVTLRITAHLRSTSTGESTKDLSRNILIHAAHYRTASITVAPKFVEPGPEEKPLIEAASKAKAQVFNPQSSANKPLWSGSFEAPVKADATDSFGTRRTFNGKLASIHKGTDFRAPSGTPVVAGNTGIVLLAEPLYFEGNCVMIDHGQGLISISMHLSRIDVKRGDKVSKGQQLGLSGATGRVTGPHLHWAIRWQGAMIDPQKLLHLDLNNLR